jgi:hypothetical protein
LLVLGSSVASARAQNDRSIPATQVPPAQSKGYDLEIVNGVLLKKGVKSSAASLKNVIDALRERYPDANIAMPPNLADVPIGDLKLRTGSLWDELEAVRVASGGKFEWKGPGLAIFFAGQDNVGINPTQSIDPATGLPSKNADYPNSGLFVLRESRVGPESERVVEAFNIGAYLDWIAENRAQDWGLKPSDPEYQRKIHGLSLNEGMRQIKEILGETVEKFNRGRTGVITQPDFEFHEGARLLVVIGTREAIEIAHKVLNALPRPATTGRELLPLQSMPPGQPGLPGGTPGQMPAPPPKSRL